MATMEKIGAFALTEPDHGSDSVALETTARRDGDHWVLDGAKRWIGNGTIADLVVVWARDTEDGQVKGFVVETGAPGYEAARSRASVAARGLAGRHHARAACGCPARTGCPRRGASGTPARCWPPPAPPARGWRWATPSPGFDAALTYTKQRTQFGKPLARSRSCRSGSCGCWPS